MPTFTITSDKPFIVLDRDEYDTLMETMEILSDEHLMRSIEQGQKDYRAGKTVKLSELRARHRQNGA